MNIVLRDFQPGDTAAVNEIALAAWTQYAGHFDDWPRFCAGLGEFAKASTQFDLIIAETDGVVNGVVGYCAPHRPKLSVFAAEWAAIRALSVHPRARGLGIGRALSEACVRRAGEDGAATIGLHTSPIMEHAIRLYLALGFEFARDLPPLMGVAYGLYIKTIRDRRE